jgi:branched-subunit amino acid transport protein AzlD
MLTIQQAIIATIICAGVTFFTRLFPFVFFARQKPTQKMAYLQRYLPPMTMVILVVYCLKDVVWASFPHGADVLCGIVVTALLHIWRGNPLISIFSGTAVYMILIRIL